MTLRLYTDNNYIDIRCKETFDLEVLKKALDSGSILEIETTDNTIVYVNNYNLTLIEVIRDIAPIQE